MEIATTSEFQLIYSTTAPYVGNCYVESISGGGTAGDVTVTSVRRQFNCNCNCRC